MAYDDVLYLYDGRSDYAADVCLSTLYNIVASKVSMFINVAICGA